jgi:chromate transporter
MSLPELVALILGFNLLAFGNGAVLVPLLQRALVGPGGILSLDQFLYAYAIGRATPGQANLYVAAIGYMTYGWLGALAMVAAIQLPGYLVLPIAKGYDRFRDVPAVRGFIRGLTAVSVSLMLSVTYVIGRETLTGALAWLVFLLTLGLVVIRRWNPLAAMLAAGCFGAVLKSALN